MERHVRAILAALIVSWVLVAAIAVGTLALLKRVDHNASVAHATATLALHTAVVQRADQASDDKRQAGVIFNICERVNAVRAQARANAGAAHAAIEALVADGIVLPERAARALRADAARLRFTLPTDCRAAAAHPTTYRPPRPQPYPPIP